MPTPEFPNSPRGAGGNALMSIQWSAVGWDTLPLAIRSGRSHIPFDCSDVATQLNTVIGNPVCAVRIVLTLQSCKMPRGAAYVPERTKLWATSKKEGP